MNLVTGGAGFIGSHLVQQLLNSSEPVRVLEHPSAEVSHLPLERIELVRADIRDSVAMRNMTRGCDRVYHLAADPNLWRHNRCEFDEINHIGTLNVMRAALDSGVSRALYVSTESILTSDQPDGRAIEFARFCEEDMIGPYCLSKFRAEQAVFQLAEAGAPVIVCSPTLPIGPGDRNQTPPTRLAVAFCQGKIPAYLDCQLNLIDVRDAADGLVRAMQLGRPGVRYLLGGHNYRLVEWLQVLGDIVNRPAPQWTIPYPAALAIGWFSELWADHISHRMPMATVTGVRLTKRSMHFDPSETFAELGLKPRPMEESTRDAVNWYRQQHWI
ncbi:MAG: NAD-dependent epimerase/dehydratase family protein [Pseudomonadota bacterium]|nr:NAD-dependent epimerase/dehydratase family protein [Pseudomonadota bacterium]